MTKRVIIIGAGPAGLIAAQKLAESDCSVHVFERKPSAARKFLMAGRGGLNLTHSEGINEFLGRYREARPFLAPFIENFTPSDLRRWCEDLGQETFVGSSGRIFPKSMKASPLLRQWLAKLDTLGVQFHFNRMWKGWDDNGDLIFEKKEGLIKVQKGDALILALGGASWPSLGSDGAWQKILKARGVDCRRLEPANCGFHVGWTDYIRRHAGEPLKNITLAHNEKSVAGEIMISEKGIEGGAIYALSADIRNAIAAELRTTVYIDLRPAMSKDDLTKKLSKAGGRASFSTRLHKALKFTPLQIALLHEANKDVGKLSPSAIADLIKALPITCLSPYPIDRAISSAGGIQLDQIDENMMIKSLPGIFAAGEMLDWEAPTGGYLLQACFATGAAAAKGALAFTPSP
ncbi:MAG: aminoacetone oxidase family FAD-binding enzyme [Micavibrio aeruginosavorus]|uniref:Aminoacetone oxidase family FAD-binding enzyme n=1 Tax=Micavibrio aeruginosavorus TaxID=349221 RepID=A0A2W5MQF8_9BACT|nr:MAG: aminoacetone oxidase family FAD-binding enzyme [Micavibrio aeruginosavorus]